MDINYSRQRVDNLIANGIEYPFVCVIAGPGYHKTQSVRGFVKKSDNRVVWLHISSKDNYAEVFWENFVDSVVAAIPELKDKLSKTSFPNSVCQIYSLLKTISKQIYDGTKVLFVLDDYASLDNDTVKNFVKQLIEASMENLCMIFISDEKIDLKETGILHHGDVFFITADDLKFNEEEIRQYFKSNNVNITDEDVVYILEKTDGWPLSLSSLLTQYPDDEFKRKSSMHNVSLVMNLFESNYFSKYPLNIQQTFVALSLLPRFTVEIVKDIAKDDTESVINEIFKNIFISFDYSTSSFVFQKMYRDFLQIKTYMLSEHDICYAYQVSGDHFFSEKNIVEALECYKAIDNYDKFIDTILNNSLKRYSRKYSDFVLNSIKHLPEEYKEGNINVKFIEAFFLLGRMEIKKSETKFWEIVKQLEEKDCSPEEREMLGEIYAAIGDISKLEDSDEFLELYKNARKYLNGQSRIRGKNEFSVRNNQAFYLPSNEAGQMDKIIESVFKSTPYVESFTDKLGYGMEYLFAGEAEMLRCNIEKAKDYFCKAMYKADKHSQLDITMNAHHNMMRIEMYLGNSKQLKYHYNEIQKINRNNNFSELAEINDYADIWLYSHLDDVESMPLWAQSTSEHKLESIPVDYGRNIIGHSVYLIGKFEYAEAIHQIRKLDDVFRERGMWQLKLTVLLMECISLMRLNKINKATEIFKKAYDMSYGNNIKFPFMEYGNLMMTMIGFIKNKADGFDPAWLNDLNRRCIEFANNKTKVVRDYSNAYTGKKSRGIELTKRELEVLGHLAKGQNREEISNELEITVNGVKKHITNIYSKLGAINRADAIRLATTNGYDL